MSHRNVQTNIKDPRRVQEQRSKIIKAAIRIIVENGFHETSVRKIGEAAGITQGTLYNYIQSKGDILYLVCDEVVTAYMDAVVKEIERTPEGASRPEAAIRALIEEIYRKQDLILLIYRESHRLDRKSLKAILARLEQSFAVFEKLLTDAAKEKPLAVKNMRVGINILSYMPTIVAMRRWDLDRHVPHRDVVDDLVGFILRGFGLEAASAAPKIARKNRVSRERGAASANKSRRLVTAV